MRKKQRIAKSKKVYFFSIIYFVVPAAAETCAHFEFLISTQSIRAWDNIQMDFVLEHFFQTTPWISLDQSLHKTCELWLLFIIEKWQDLELLW